MPRPGTLQWKLVEQKRVLHVTTKFEDGWAVRAKGPSFYALCRSEGSPELFGRATRLKAWASGPVSLAKIINELEPHCCGLPGCAFYVEAGFVHWIIPFRRADESPSPDIFDTWTPERVDGVLREWRVYLSAPGAEAKFRFVIVLEAASRNAPTVRIRTENGLFVPGGLPTLGKRR